MGNYHSNHHSNQGISQLNYLSMWPHLVPLVLLKPVHSIFPMLVYKSWFLHHTMSHYIPSMFDLELYLHIIHP